MVKALECYVDLIARGVRMTWEACVQWHVCLRAITEASRSVSLPRAVAKSWKRSRESFCVGETGTRTDLEGCGKFGP